MGALLQDIQYSVRTLRKSPGFTCVVILTLGLGIGFNTAIYSVINAFILRPLPVRDPDQLVVLATRDKHTEVPHGLSYPDYRDYRGLTGVFADVLARREFPFAANWRRGHQTERIWIDAVTTNYFNLLAVGASLGRTFLPDETRKPVAARLKPGATIAQARTAVTLLAAQLQRQYPDTNKGVSVITIPERFARPEPQVSEKLPAMAAFSMAIVGLVLLIACANIANLWLVRATQRSREMALRTAVGASRFRIVRLLLTESVLLGVVGGAAGVLAAHWSLALIQSRPSSIDFPVHLNWSPDGRVLLFATGVALLTGILCGLMPALEIAPAGLAAALREGTARVTGHKRRLTSLLVGGQVGVSMLLLIVAGLFIRGAQKAQESDLGFDRNHLQLLSVDLARQNYDQTRGREFIQRLLDEIEVMPGARVASVAKYIPFDLQGSEAVFSDEQAASRRADALAVLSNAVGVGYFQVMGIPLLKGREFNKHDDESAPRVAVINEALALRLWPGKDPLQRRIRLANGDVLQVIGVVKTGKYAFLTEQPRPYLYLPLWQNDTSPTTFHIRTAGPTANVAAALRQAIRALDPDLPVYNVKTMQEHLQHGYVFSTIILGGALSGLVGTLGLALASIGLYGVVANSVSQRTREIGVRTALGASSGDILRLVMRQSVILILAGATAGIVSGLVAARLLRRVLFSVDPADFKTFLTVVAVLVIVAVMACLLPARRAVKLDPTVALRWE